MKITIDTKEDSPEEIRKAITFLHSLSNSGGGAYIPAPSEPQDTTNLMSMFGDDSTAPTPASPATSDTAPNFGSFLNLVDQKKETSKKYLDEPKIEFY